MSEILTPEKRAAIMEGIRKTWCPDVMEYTRGMLRDRGLLADSEIFDAVHRQIDTIHGVKRR